MLLSKACKEVLEGVLLFMVHQYGHLSAATAQRLQPRVSASIFTEENTTTEAVTWSVRVDASDLGVYYLDGRLFITKLCDHGSNVRAVITTTRDGGEKWEVTVLSRRIGEYTTVQRHVISLVSGSDCTVEECVIPRPPDFPPSGLRVCFQGRCTVADMKKEAHELSSHMQYLHLINPDVEMGLLVKANSEVLVASQHPRELGWHPHSTSPHKLTTSMHHYTSAVTKQIKLRLTRGAVTSLPSLTLRDNSQISLKLLCSAAVVPHISLRRGRKIPANRTCQYLHVYVFGPNSLPVLGVGSLSTFPLSGLANWENYGLTLSAQQESTEGVRMVSSGCCRLSDNRATNSGSNPERSSRMKHDRSLLLFVFLEDGSGSSGTGAVGHCTTQYWGQQMDRVHELRDEVEGLLQSQQRKFKQATHSVLNKLLCNYGTHIKTASVLHTALPLLADAVTGIIRNSSNDHFKQRCKDILDVQNQNEVEKECISERLWKIAEEKLSISKTQTVFPQEPPSPELGQTASENSVPDAPTANEPSTEQSSSVNALVAMPTSRDIRDSQIALLGNHQQSHGTNTNQQHSNSLFEAMIYSRRTKRNVLQASMSTAGLSGEGREGTSKPARSSFDALAELVEEPSETEDTQSDETSFLPEFPDSDCIAEFPNTTSTTLTDSYFEDLATVIDSEESTLLATVEKSMHSTRLEYDDDDSLTEMDWGDNETGEEVEEMDDKFSDFPVSDEDTTTGLDETMNSIHPQRLEPVRVNTQESSDEWSEAFLASHRDKGYTTGARYVVDGLNNAAEGFLNRITTPVVEHISSIPRLPTPSTAATNPTVIGPDTCSTQCDFTASDSDWEQLGDLLEDDCIGHATHQQPAGVKKNTPQQEPVAVSSSMPHTVPDLSHITADIDEEDFNWD